MNVDSNASTKVKVNAMAAGAKFRSKKECFQFLVIDCETYLPDDEACAHLVDAARRPPRVLGPVAHDRADRRRPRDALA